MDIAPSPFPEPLCTPDVHLSQAMMRWKGGWLELMENPLFPSQLYITHWTPFHFPNPAFIFFTTCECLRIYYSSSGSIHIIRIFFKNLDFCLISGLLHCDGWRLPLQTLFTLFEFRTALSKCKDGALGPDDIYFMILRHIHPTASAFLLHLFNRIWVEYVFLSLWTTAYAVPMSKLGKDPYFTDNQSHISLTCHTCILLEKMVSDRLVLVLDGLLAFFDFQFGFQQHR